jgi:hypothetical protein
VSLGLFIAAFGQSNIYPEAKKEVDNFWYDNKLGITLFLQQLV